MTSVNGYTSNYRYVAKHVEDKHKYYSTTVEPVLTDLVRLVALHHPSDTKEFLAGPAPNADSSEVPSIPEDAESTFRKILKALLLEQPKNVHKFVKSYCSGKYVPSRAASERSIASSPSPTPRGGREEPTETKKQDAGRSESKAKPSTSDSSTASPQDSIRLGTKIGDAFFEITARIHGKKADISLYNPRTRRQATVTTSSSSVLKALESNPFDRDAFLKAVSIDNSEAGLIVTITTEEGSVGRDTLTQAGLHLKEGYVLATAVVHNDTLSIELYEPRESRKRVLEVDANHQMAGDFISNPVPSQLKRVIETLDAGGFQQESANTATTVQKGVAINGVYLIATLSLKEGSGVLTVYEPKESLSAKLEISKASSPEMFDDPSPNALKAFVSKCTVDYTPGKHLALSRAA